MPIYVFKCEDHEELHEKILTWSDYDKFKSGELKYLCPVCEKEMQRTVTQTNFQLNGSGWHNTDYTKHGRK